MTKQEIRAEMRKRRKAVTAAERAAASARICERLAAMLAGDCASIREGRPPCRLRPRRSAALPCIAVYLASADEIDLAPFVNKVDALRLVAPRWNGTVYELAELGGELVVGPHGILEPPPEARRVAADEVGAWIVPGLAFTRDGQRLGYGGGWYDRMMGNARPDALKVGVGYRFQVVEALPSEPHDIRLDAIVTD